MPVSTYRERLAVRDADDRYDYRASSRSVKYDTSKNADKASGGGGAVGHDNETVDTTEQGKTVSSAATRTTASVASGVTGSTQNDTASQKDNALDSEEALMDLAQLEELHSEAERMKALGNKHMATQEYTRAYNAYSAALQLSPVGPSSHVFLSNRAAALLSLKRYGAAATDARRAVALAPTFGKAHARLGQALYFMKNYSGAVESYKDALRYEPDNQVTQTYLEKAQHKLEKKMKRRTLVGGEDVSVITEGSSHLTIAAASIATDKGGTGVVTSGYRGNRLGVLSAAASPGTASGGHQAMGAGFSQRWRQDYEDDDDPDFDESVRIQQRANQYLANKKYKSAIEEYTAALFLCPDDPNLSPELHLGRAHALNGSRRHESARNDAQLAIKIKPSAAAYSTLAKSLFYTKDYRGALEAFAKCEKMLPGGETLGTFDMEYVKKSKAALEEPGYCQPGGSASVMSGTSSVPKLPPPRFVPREQALQNTANVPPMPKNWPQQSPTSKQGFRVGVEREVIFLSESLGIKLNRGPDGVVRIFSVAPNTPTSQVLRNGKIEAGDVVREAAGVDIRRPITNVMWGDTVALIKMAPRPITLVVARELSEPPPSVLEEREKCNSP